VFEFAIIAGVLAVTGVTVIAMLYADKKTEEYLRKQADDDAENLKKQRDVTVNPSKSPSQWMRKWKR
jgi:uncharacterized protein (DUF2225 family)